MVQFDVYKNLNKASNTHRIPYMLDVQHDAKYHQSL